MVNNNQGKNPRVDPPIPPKPSSTEYKAPYQSIASPEEDDAELLPQLKRDDKASVAATLYRLKKNSAGQSPSKEAITVKTAGRLRSDDEVADEKKRRRTILFLISITILTLVLIAGVLWRSDQNRVINRTNSSGFDFSGNNITVTPDGLATALSQTSPNNRYIITFKNTVDELATETNPLSAIGFNFDTRLQNALASDPILLVERDTANQTKLAMIVLTNDFANASRGLRDWERDIFTSKPYFITLDETGTTIDRNYQNLDYRVMAANLA